MGSNGGVAVSSPLSPGIADHRYDVIALPSLTDPVPSSPRPPWPSKNTVYGPPASATGGTTVALRSSCRVEYVVLSGAAVPISFSKAPVRLPKSMIR